MKKTYLVKKNPSLPDGADNWIIMNGYEFARFIETEEGQRRKKNFAQLDACGDDDDIIVAECGEERANEWRAEKDSHDYLRKCEMESGIETISFTSINENGEEINLDELIADFDSNVVIQVIREQDRDKLNRIMKLMTRDEYILIYELFFADAPMTLSDIAKRDKIAVSTVMRRRNKIFKKYFQ